MSLKTWNRVNMMEAVTTYLRGSQTDRHTTVPNARSRRPQIPGDQQTTSDDLYASDPSTVGDNFSFVSSRRSSIGLPVGTSGSRGQGDNRQSQNKTAAHPVRVMTPIIDSRMASREVTLNAIPLLPPIAVKAAPQDREALPKSDDKVFEKMLRDEEEKLSQMLSGVLKVGGFIQAVDDAKRTSGPSSVRSFGSFKGGYTQRHPKKNIYQKPALKGVGGPADGSVMMMPGGEVIQVGHSITIADNDQKKRPAFDAKGALTSDALLIQKLAEGARNLASLVLSNPEMGQDLNNDALRAAELWMATRLEMPEARLEDVQVQKAIISAEDSLRFTTTANNETTDQSVAEYKEMLTGTLLNVVSRLSGRDLRAYPKEASISPELMQSLLTRTVDPKEITVVDDATGRSVITVRSGKTNSKKKTASQEMETFNGLSAAGVHENASSFVNARNTCSQQADSSKNLTDEQKNRETAGKSDGKAVASSELLLPLSKDAKKSVDPKNSKETTEGGGGGTLKTREFVVGKVDDKSELGKLYGKSPEDSKKSATKRKKKKKKLRKGETDGESPPGQSEVNFEPNKKNDQNKDPSEEAKSKKKTMEPLSMEEASEDVDFVFASETWSDDEPIISPRSRISNAHSTKSPQTDDDANQPSYFSDTSSSSKNEANKLNRAAQREAKAELRRQDVQRKRREREEHFRREKEEAERMEQMVRDLEEERLRKEEAKRLERERLEESRRRREEDRLARERRAELEAERERRMKEEYMKKLEEMKRKQEEEARSRAELEEKMRLEEAERQRLEQLMLAQMEADEREQYLRTKREEEEKLRKLEEEEKRRRLEEQQRAAEEAMRMAQEIARKQAELQRRLEFNRSLHSEAGNLSQSQAVTRAFVFSYLELLNWLSLDHPSDNAQANYAKMQKSE